MTIKEIETILYNYRKQCSIYDKKLYALCKLRYEMQGLKGLDYSAVRVQGGEISPTIEKLIDKELELEKEVNKCLLAKSTAYDGAIRLIYLLNNKDHLCDIVSEFFLLDKSISYLAGKYHYNIQTCYNKIYKSKRILVKITEAKGLTKEDFNIF